MNATSFKHWHIDFAGHRFKGPVHRAEHMPCQAGVLLVLDVQQRGVRVIKARPEKLLMVAMEVEQAYQDWRDEIQGQPGFAYVEIANRYEAMGVAVDAVGELARHERASRRGLTSGLLVPTQAKDVRGDFSTARRQYLRQSMTQLFDRLRRRFSSASSETSNSLEIATRASSDG